jgi:TP901 family phage tail tape measure protein
MANSLITIQLKLDALKIQVETPTVKSLGEPASAPTGASSRAKQPSGGAPSLGLDELRAQFNALAGDLRAASDSIRGIQDIASVFNAFSESLKDAASNIKATKADAPSGAASSTGDTEAKAKEEQAKRQASADADAAASSAKKTESTKEGTAADREAAQAAEENAQATKEAAQAQAKSTDGMDAIIKAAARLQVQFLEGTDVTKASAAAQEKLNQISKARTAEELKLGSSAAGKKSQIATLFESILPVSLDSEFKLKADKFNSTAKGLFVNFAPGVNKASDAVKNLEAELARIQRTSSQRIKGDPTGVDPIKEAASVRGQQEQALIRFKEAGGGGNVQFQESKAALFAASFQAQTSNILDAMKQLSNKIESGASEIEIETLEGAVKQAIVGITDFSARLINASATPFVTTRPDVGGGATGARQDLTPLILQNIIPKQAKQELTAFQQGLLTLAQTLIKTEEVTSVLPRIFRELTKDVANFETNQRVLRQGLQFGGTQVLGGPDRADVLKGVQAGLTTKTGAGGDFITPVGTDAATSFELLNANIQKLKLNVKSLAQGTKLDKVFSFTDAAGNVRKVQASVKQLGSTLASVQVRAREVSKDLFSRVTVRAALSRVATWGAAAGLVFGAINAFKGAVKTIVDTESSVVKLAKVMNESKEGFDQFAEAATKAGLEVAQKFGQPLEDVLQTMITFGQQGLSFPEVEAGTEASALASVVTTLNQPQAAEALTAATEQFGLNLSDATSIVDKFNNVANNAAVTETVLAEALKKSGIAASNAGVDLDQFNGIVAAIAEQTRQSGNEVGTALRFIFSRINTQEAERGLGKVGVAIKDAQGNLRPFVEVITDLKDRFGSLSKAQQTQAAISVAGTRRFNTLLALLKNFSTFQDSVANSTNSAGTSIEQAGIVAETAAFKITQMKNSAAAAAVSFGGVLAPALKIATDVASGFFNIISGMPTVVQALAVSLGAAGIAFAKFSQTFVALGDAAIPGGGVFSTLAGSLTQGISKEAITQSTPGVAANIANVAGGGGEAIFAARSIGDFSRAKDASENFAQSIKNSGRVLVDMNGQAVKNTANMTKFTAVTRGYRTAAKDAFDTAGKASVTSNLGLLAMNTTIGRMSAAAVGLSSRFLRFLKLGKGLDLLDGALDKTNSSVLRFSGSLLKIGASVGIIILAYKAFQAASEFLTKDGDAVAKSLEPEIAKRQKLIRELSKQQSAVERLAQSQRELLRLQVEDTQQPEEVRREAIRRGDFKSPKLEQQRLDSAQRDVNNQVGFANPQLIDSFDEFGNVILKTSDAFESLAGAAGTANERLLALAQSKIAKAFLEDQDATDGFFKSIVHGTADAFDFLPFMDDVADATISVGKRFKEAQNSLKSFTGLPNISDAIEEANRLGIPLRDLNSDISKELDSLTKNVQEAAGPVTESYLKIIKALESAPPGQAVTLLNDLGDAVESLAAKQSAFSGVATSTSDFAERFALTNSEALKGIKSSIKFNAEDTKEALNEAGFLASASTIGKRTKQEFSKSFSEGDLVIVDGRQLQVEINAFGERVVKVWNEATERFDQVRLADVFTTDGLQQVFSFAAQGLKEQISRTVLELGRETTGAGRGSLLTKDFNLGADRGFDLSAQQRVSQSDESLIADLLSAEKALTIRRDEFKAKLETGDALVTTDIVAQILKLQAAVDETSTIVKFRTKIEEVGKSFEKAIDDIEKSNIGERIITEFSGVLGAERGAVPRNFNTPLNRADLSAEQRSNVDAPELVRFVNSVTDAEKAQGELIKNATLAIRDIDKIGQDFRTARAAGGLADQASLSQLASAALGAAGDPLDVKLHQVTVDQLSEDKKQTKFLERIAAAEDLGPAQLITALTDGLKSGSLAGDQSGRAGGLTAEQLKDVSTSSLVEFAKTQGTKTPSNIQEEIISRQVRAQRGSLNLDAITSKLGASTAIPSNFIQEASKELKNQLAGQTVSIELDPTTKALINAAIQAGAGGGAPAGQLVNQIRNSLVESGGDVAKGINKQLSEEGGLEQVNAGILEFLNNTSAVFKDIAPIEPAPARSFDEEQALARRQASDTAAGARRTLESSFFQDARELAEVFALLVDTSSEVEKSFQDNLISSFNELETSRALANLGVAGAPSGLTAGAEKLTFDIGKQLTKDLTGRELTQLQSPSLIASANTQKVALDALVKVFQDTNSAINKLTTARGEAEAKGQTGKVATIDTELSKFNLQLSILKPQIEDSADALKRFGEAVNESDAINQLTVDIDSLFKALEKEVDLTFDRTSIESGLGNTVFSLLRPTFEQFEQGQAGFATAFERAIASIDFQEAGGDITSKEADRLRGKAEFERDEGVIKLAQDKENKSLQIQISAAEQIRKRLLDFASSGGEGAEQARGLFDQLTADLESAGDIIQSGVSSRTIRNPLTGRDEEVPASQILEFKGLPSLEGLQAEVGKLAKQSQEEQAAKNASLINEPIVSAIEAMASGVIGELVDLKKGSEARLGDANRQVSSLGPAAEIAQEIGRLRIAPQGSAQTQKAVDVKGKVAALVSEKGLETATKALEATFVDASTNIPQALEEFSTSTTASKESIDLVNETLGLFSTNMTEMTEKFDLAKSGLENFLEVLNKSSSAVTGLGIGSVQKRAAGGLIFGPGGPKDDKVPILASPGEFVVNAAAVNKFGAKNLEAINAQGSTGVQEGNKFKNGGFVFGEDERNKSSFNVVSGKTKEEQEEEERRKKELFSSNPQNAQFTAAESVGALARKGDIVVEGPTGKLRFQRDVNLDTIRSLGTAAQQAPSKADLEARVSDLRSEEKRRVLDEGGDNKQRLRSLSGAAFRGNHFIEYKEDGTLSFSGSPNGRNIKLDRSLQNVDISSEKAFNSAIKERKDRLSRINKVASSPTQESLETRRKAVLQAEDARVGKIDDVENSFITSKQRVYRSIASSSHEVEVRQALADLQRITELINTAEGREELTSNRGVVNDQLFNAENVISKWTDRFSNARPTSFQFRHPLTNELIGEELSLLLGEGAVVTPGQSIKGGSIYQDSALVQQIISGSVLAQYNQVRGVLDERQLLTQTKRFGDFSGLADHLANSDLSSGTKGGLAVGLGFLNKPSQIATGVRDLGVSGAKGAADFSKNVVTGDFESAGRNLKNASIGLKNAGVGVVTGLKETIEAPAEFTAALISGADDEEIVRLGQKTGGAAFDALTAVASAPSTIAQVKNLPTNAKNLATGLKNAPGALKNRTISAAKQAKEALASGKNKVVTAGKSLSSKFAERAAIKVAKKEATAAKLAENAATERAILKAAEEAAEEVATQTLTRPDFLPETGKKGRIRRFFGAIDTKLAQPLSRFIFPENIPGRPGAGFAREALEEAASAKGFVSPINQSSLQSILDNVIEGSDLIPTPRRVPFGAEVGEFAAAPVSNIVLPSRLGAFDPSARGGTSIAGSGNVFTRALDSFRLSRAIRDDSLAGIRTAARADSSLIAQPRTAAGTPSLVNLDDPFPFQAAGPVPGSPIIPSRLDIAQGKGARFQKPAGAVKTTSTQAFLERVTGFRSLKQAQEAIERLKIPQSRLDSLVGASPVDIAKFRKSFRDLEAGKAGPLPARSKDKRNVLIGEKESVVGLRTDRGARRGGTDNLVTTRERLKKQLEGRKQAEALIASKRRLGQLPDRSEFPAAGASDLGIDFEGAGSLARTSALGKKVPKANLVDNLLGNGAFDTLKKAGVELEDSVFDNLLKGKDIKGITRDLKDELLKASVSREEFIQIRQLRSGQSGKIIPGRKSEVNPEVNASVREYIQADKANKAKAAEQEAFLEGAPPIEELLKKLQQENEGPSASAVFRAEAKAAGKVLKEAAKKEGVKRISKAELVDLPGVDEKNLRALKGTKGFATGGKVTGPGGPKSDQVPILASNGEFVVNAETVNRLGLPFFESINKGQSLGGKFANGGVIGSTNAGNTEITVNVNTDEMSSSISDAITSALESAELPELEVNLDGVSVPVEYPDNGIPLDSSGLSLGDSLGSAVRNRLESVEGTVDGLREDSNKVLDLVENVDFSSIASLTEDVSSIKDTLEPLEERVLVVEGKFETQKQEILTEMFTFVNEQIDNISVGTDINARIDIINAKNETTFDALRDNIFQAIDTANRAMTKALARN